MRLLGRFLETLKFHCNARVCVGVLKAGIFAETGSEKADSDGLVDYARSIDGVEVALLLEQLPNGVKGSLRSKTPEMRVNEIAAKFGGGGHCAAAGFTAEGEKLETFYDKAVAAIQARLNEFDTRK